MKMWVFIAALAVLTGEGGRCDAQEIVPHIADGYVEFRFGPTAGDTLRLELQNQVRPRIEASFGVGPEDGTLTYSYRLANLSDAKQPVILWQLVFPEAVSAKSVRAPRNWGWFLAHTQTSTVRHALPGVRTGGIFVWERKISPADPIEPGREGFFELTTAFLPGVVRAYVLGQVDHNQDEVVSRLPREAAKYLAAEGTGKSVFTIGPVFSRNTDRIHIVRAFLDRLHEPDLLKDERLDAQFIDELTERLTTYERKLQSGTAATQEHLSLCCAVRKTFPNTFQREIARAVEIDLCPVEAASPQIE